MPTKKLFYEDCNLRSFTATVLSCQPAGAHWQVTLDATAFYPEGGGQACDLGRLGTARVLDVQEQQEQILHLCDGPLEVGSRVEGHIDWDRRFDLMQQHSGEHIVSGLVHTMLGHHNVGFHVGKELMQIDFDGPITQEQLTHIERQANAVVCRDLPIRCWYPEQEALPGIFYRTKKQLPWPVRLVQIPDTDCCACCGVHVATTGQIGLIKLVSVMKFHQGVRVELCCGSRAVALVQQVFEQNRQVSQVFSAQLLQTGQAAQKMSEALAAEKLRAAALQTQLLRLTAQGYAGKGNSLIFFPGLEPAAVRQLADLTADVCGGWAAVLSGSDGAYNVCILTKTGDIGPLCQALKTQLQARGGGKPGAFQGSVPASEPQLRAFFGAFL